MEQNLLDTTEKKQKKRRRMVLIRHWTDASYLFSYFTILIYGLLTEVTRLKAERATELHSLPQLKLAQIGPLDKPRRTSISWCMSVKILRHLLTAFSGYPPPSLISCFAIYVYELGSSWAKTMLDAPTLAIDALQIRELIRHATPAATPARTKSISPTPHKLMSNAEEIRLQLRPKLSLRLPPPLNQAWVTQDLPWGRPPGYTSISASASAYMHIIEKNPKK